MRISRSIQAWSGLGPQLHATKVPPPEEKTRTYLVTMRRSGKSMILTIPAPIHKKLSLYEGAPMYLEVTGKVLRLTRADTVTTSQIELLKAHYPKAHVPWAKKIHLFGPNHPKEQYELQGLPNRLITRLLSGGREPES